MLLACILPNNISLYFPQILLICNLPHIVGLNFHKSVLAYIFPNHCCLTFFQSVLACIFTLYLVWIFTLFFDCIFRILLAFIFFPQLSCVLPIINETAPLIYFIKLLSEYILVSERYKIPILWFRTKSSKLKSKLKFPYNNGIIGLITALLLREKIQISYKTDH